MSWRLASRCWAAAAFGWCRRPLALAPILRELTEREPIQPAMLGRPEGGHDLALRMADHAAWWAGFDPEAARRLGLALARVLGTWRWLKGPLLQQAWFSALVGWAAARSQEGLVRTGDLGAGDVRAMCGRGVELAAVDRKPRDLVATWREALHRARHRNRLKEKDL